MLKRFLAIGICENGCSDKKRTHLEHAVEHSKNDVHAGPHDGIRHGEIRPQVPHHLQLGGPWDAAGPEVSPKEFGDGTPAWPVLRRGKGEDMLEKAQRHDNGGSRQLALGGKQQHYQDN